MTKGQLYGAAVIVLVICWAAGIVPGILATLGVGGLYVLSLLLSPRARHTGFRGCNGTGELHGFLFRHAHRKCPRCQSGRIIRFGARFAGLSHVRSEAATTRAARAAARDEHRWR